MALITTYKLTDGEWIYSDRACYDFDQIDQEASEAILNDLDADGFHTRPNLKTFNNSDIKIKVSIGQVRQWIKEQPLTGKAWISTVYCEDFEGIDMSCRLIQQVAFEKPADALVFKLTFGGE